MKSWLKWGLIIVGILIVTFVIYFTISRIFAHSKPIPTAEKITNFEECIAAGNPAMESYPRQCRDPISDRTFVEAIEGVPGLQ